MIAIMATPISSSSRTALLPEGGQTFYNNIPPRHRLERNKKLSILFKFIQLMITVACLVLFSAGGQLFTDIKTTAFTYGTYGAYIVIPVFLIAGFIIGEVTPVLLGNSIQTMCLTNDDEVLRQAEELAREAKSSKQYTDVNGFNLKCL